MREAGLIEAIRAAGGVRALAHKIGISQPSVSNWTRVPADRVRAVEAATGVSRAVLRPDLFNPTGQTRTPLDGAEVARAQDYALLSLLLARAPDRPLLTWVAALPGDESPLGRARAALAEAAVRVRLHSASREFLNLFVGIEHGELPPYRSFYRMSAQHDRPLAHLDEYLSGIGLEQKAERAEPDDHVATLCEIMARLVASGLETRAEIQADLFGRYFAPWMGRFFADLEHAQHADFYRNVGRLGRVFLEVEMERFGCLHELQ
jgi:TorA maturation chaperone TorD